LPRKNSISKRGKSGKLSTLQKIEGVGESTEEKFLQAQKDLRAFKQKAKSRGVEVNLSIPRVTSFETAEQVRQTIKHVNTYLKNPTVTIPSNKNQLPFKLIEKETKLVNKLNRPIKAFQERIGKEIITVNGKKQEETVKEYLGKKRQKDYTFNPQYRYLQEEELKERVKELSRKAKKNVQREREKGARKSYLKALKQEGLHSSPEGQALLNHLEKMSLRNFIDTLSTEVNVSFNFVYDDNLENEGKIDTLIKAWGVKPKTKSKGKTKRRKK